MLWGMAVDVGNIAVGCERQWACVHCEWLAIRLGE